MYSKERQAATQGGRAAEPGGRREGSPREKGNREDDWQVRGKPLPVRHVGASGPQALKLVIVKPFNKRPHSLLGSLHFHLSRQGLYVHRTTSCSRYTVATWSVRRQKRELPASSLRVALPLAATFEDGRQDLQLRFTMQNALTFGFCTWRWGGFLHFDG